MDVGEMESCSTKPAILLIAAWVFEGHSLKRNSLQRVSAQSVLLQVSKLSTSTRDSAEHEW